MNNINEISYMDDDSSESNDLDFEFVKVVNGKEYYKTYSVKKILSSSIKKRLLCFSVIHNTPCKFRSSDSRMNEQHDGCTYAHTLDEQLIDYDRKFIYQITLDKYLMNFYSIANPKTDELYRQMIGMTYLCKKCQQNKCTGGYNCKHGANIPDLKICKNDLLTGQCFNITHRMKIDPNVITKIMDASDTIPCDEYISCINGHHLTVRGLMPYYKHIQQQENNQRSTCHAVRYINNIHNYYPSNNQTSFSSDDLTDDEVNSWFKKDDTSSSESDN